MMRLKIRNVQYSLTSVLYRLDKDTIWETITAIQSFRRMTVKSEVESDSGKSSFLHLIYKGMQSSRESCGRFQISPKSLRMEVK